jgi:integrase
VFFVVGRGSIVRRNNNIFYLVLSLEKIGDKYPQKWVKLHAKTLKQAETERDFVYTDRRRGVWIEPHKITVCDFMKQYLTDMEKAVSCGRVAQSTFEWYEKRIRLHIQPVIGGIKLSEMKARDLQNLYDNKYVVSPNLAEAVYRILHAVWAAAVLDDDLDVRNNSADKIHRCELGKPTPITWTGDQIAHFLRTAKTRRYYEIFLLGFGTGMRFGEILGLTWDDIDYKNMVINVKRSITLNQVYNLENLFKKVKTVNSVRDIRMIPSIANALKDLKRKQNAERLAAENYLDLNLVFTTETGSPVNYSNIRENYWHWLTDKMDLPRMKLHGMRHYVESQVM